MMVYNKTKEEIYELLVEEEQKSDALQEKVKMLERTAFLNEHLLKLNEKFQKDKLCKFTYCGQKNEKLVYCELCFLHKQSQLETISKMYSENYFKRLAAEEENKELKAKLMAK